MLQQQITSLKQMNLQIQNDFEELEQYGRRLSLSIDGGTCQGEGKKPGCF